MTEAELYKELVARTKEKNRWEENIPYVASLLTHDSVKIQAKALWLLGEMGLLYSQSVQDVVPAIAAFLDRLEPLLRERAVNALGRIGNVIKLRKKTKRASENLRGSFIIVIKKYIRGKE